MIDAQVGFHWPWSATPAAASVLKYKVGTPHWCALQCERALADIAFGDVAPMLFPASMTCPAMGLWCKSGLTSAPGHGWPRDWGKEGGNEQKVSSRSYSTDRKLLSTKYL